MSDLQKFQPLNDLMRLDLNIRYIDHEFIEGFDFYFHTAKYNGANTASRHLKNLGKTAHPRSDHLV